MTNIAHSFKVDAVKAEPAQLDQFFTTEKWRNQFFKQDVKALGVRGESIEAYKLSQTEDAELRGFSAPSFIDTCNKAFDQHVPLMLSPDDVWLTISQAVGKHINYFPEDCRKAIVNWEGQKYIEVRADHFVKGQASNDWEWAFGQFGEQIEKHLGKKRDLFDPTFTTTTPTTKAAIQVQMMSSLSSYFRYGMRTCCGIPEITLLGKVEDWEGIMSRVEAFGEFYPKWAHDPLIYVAGHFLEAANKRPSQEFWKNFVKVSDGSGGPFVSGFINAFYPYVGPQKPNNMLVSHDSKPFYDNVMQRKWGPPLADFPSSNNSVDMTWFYYEQKFDMKLVSGIFGTAIDKSVHPEGAFRPLVGWAVGEKSASE